YNTAVVVGPHGRLYTYLKLRLPNQVEKEWYVPGRELPVIESQGWKFGVFICFDIDKPDLFTAAAANGAEFALCPVGGRGFSDLIGRDGDQPRQAHKHRELHLPLLVEGARDSRMYLFYTNQAGRSNKSMFPGLALAVDPHGELVGEHLPTE